MLMVCFFSCVPQISSSPGHLWLPFSLAHRHQVTSGVHILAFVFEWLHLMDQGYHISVWRTGRSEGLCTANVIFLLSLKLLLKNKSWIQIYGSVSCKPTSSLYSYSEMSVSLSCVVISYLSWTTAQLKSVQFGDVYAAMFFTVVLLPFIKIKWSVKSVITLPLLTLFQSTESVAPNN